jgi:hypothetical protein
MIQDNEIIMLLIGIGVLIFIIGNRQQLRRFIFSEILILGFYLTLAGWILTILEGFFFKDLLNLIEHACYAGSSVSVAFWCYKVFGSRREGR